tara:strand:+ start:3537 stop:4076 length:540 start_codon:yes stop_codon:yes gene_type:complete
LKWIYHIYYFIIKKNKSQFNTLQKKIKLKIKKFPIKINSKGEWFYNGSLIRKKALIKIFASVLVSDGKGNFYLETPAEKGKIEVEDTPFVIINFGIKGLNKNQEIIFKTNIGEEIILSKKNPLFYKKSKKSFIPYIIIRKNICAKILRPVYYQLIYKFVNKNTRNKLKIKSKGYEFTLK